MGNCFSGIAGGTQRQSKWRTTGIVSLRDEGIRSLPSSLLPIAASVRVLDLSGNELKALPNDIWGKFVDLQRLIVSNNDHIGPTICPSISTLKRLRFLALDGCHLASLPDRIGDLHRLEHLHAQNNNLAELPESIADLKALKELDVCNNTLARLPDCLGGLTALVEIKAAYNQLHSLPASLGALPSLRLLLLDHNHIASIPPAVLRAPSLHTLALHSNPITPADLEATPGYAEYEARRAGKYDKAIASGAMLPSSGMDEGVDRLLAGGSSSRGGSRGGASPPN